MMTPQISANANLHPLRNPIAAITAGGHTPDFLVFRLGGEQFGVDFQHVVEIRHFSAATPISNVPGYIKGVVNFRGHIAPVVDMRLKFGLEPCVRDALTDTIFLEIEDRFVGLMVDGAATVVNLATQRIRPAREFMSVVDSDLIFGVAEFNGQLITLLDIERLVHSPEIALI